MMRVTKSSFSSLTVAPKWVARYSAVKGDEEQPGDRVAYVRAWTQYGARVAAARQRDWLVERPYLTVQRVHEMPLGAFVRVCMGLFLGGFVSAMVFWYAPQADSPQTFDRSAYAAPEGYLEQFLPAEPPHPNPAIPVYVYYDNGHYDCVLYCPEEDMEGWHCRYDGNRWCGGRFGEPR